MTESPPSNRSKRVTLADVARRARIDPSVVSRVINRDERLVIKDETRERVQAAIRELNYHPNAAARSLRTSQSGVIGLLIPDFANPVYAEIIKGAEQAAAEHGSLLLVGTAFPDRPQRYIEMLASGRVEGLLLAAGPMPPEVISAMRASGRPVISVNQRVPGIDGSVLADDEAASRLAVEHLIQLGHTRIAHIRGPHDSDTAKRRLAGYKKALRAAGLELGAVVGDGYAPADGTKGMVELLATSAPPTAVLVANVAAAIGAMSAARRAGISVPDDMSVVAIHDLPLAEVTSPALTTVRMPLAEMGYRAFQMVIAASDSSKAAPTPQIVRDPTELITRESTAPPKN